MKKTQIAIFSFLLISLVAWAKSQEATIKSSLVCGMCEDNIRNGLVYEKGIKRVTFDLDKSEVYVKFNPKHISLNEIETLITEIGYDANEKKADPIAFKNLDECCQSKEKCLEMENHGDGHNHKEGEGHEHHKK